MQRLCLAAVAVALGACASTSGSGARDWTDGAGKSLAAGFQRDMARELAGRDSADALERLRADGYDCDTGEAHERHPDPMSVCRKSFATRACQMDWEVALTPKRSIVRSVETEFTRDCVGTDRDWPEAKRSAIDVGLARPKLDP